MDMTSSIDLGQVARDLGIPREQVQRTIELLDEGNTVPFITRYRKDETGGLDEEQIRAVQAEVRRQRQLAERKLTILKSIEAQGRLTPELTHQIQSSRSLKHLEDLYLPFKPKKQTLATLARQRGLEPLADEILAGSPEAHDLPARAAQFLKPELKLVQVEEVLAGVGHLLAERFSERADLRSRLRRVLQRSGRLTSVRIEPEKRAEAAQAAQQAAAEEVAEAADAAVAEASATTPGQEGAPVDSTSLAAPHAAEWPVGETDDDAALDPHAEEVDDDGEDTEEADDDDALDETLLAEHLEATSELATTAGDEPTPAAAVSDGPAATDSTAAVAESLSTAPSVLTPGPDGLPQFAPAEGPRVVIAPTAIPALSPGPLASRLSAKQQARAAARDAKKKKKQKLLESLYKDYYQYQEPLGKIPAHRILAINRGERAHVLRVRIEADAAAVTREAEELLIPPGHPHAAFLRDCVRDALTRLVVPSLERELRREMTDRAEQHAVEVFIRNLRKLLLQPPVHGRRVLAIDPGFRSGCKLAALDEFGSLIDHSTIHVIGSEQHRQLCRQRLVELIRKHKVAVVAIGNGTACRETEQLIADILGNELANSDIAYVVVNEAGASVYSTSPIGREELPKYDATVRGAVSIGRRLLDPLSELVKINPANIGVGLYQHDLKAKHLRDSLDEVVESCVNYVGVDVNTASPALLRYVSGLNQLTARRLYEHRLQHGPFRNREQFRDVAGFGEATFVQAAGFLKIRGGDNPLDATWIHPESYDAARRVLAKLDSDVQQLASEVGVPPLATAPVEPVESVSTRDASEPAAGPGEPGEPGESVASPSGASESSPEETGVAGDRGAQADPEPVAIAPEAAAVDSAVATADPAVGPAASAEAAGGEPASASEALDVAAAGTSAWAEPLAERIARVDVLALAQELAIGSHLLSDILSSLARPTRDPREDLPPPIFRRGIVRLEDLAAGMELAGTVLNVVDFGVFVDIGLSDSALIHISRLADRFIRDPHEVVGVGDVLKVWVVDVDKQRRRVSLTAIAPGSERPRPERPQRPERPPARPQQGQRPGGQRPAGQRGSGPPAHRTAQRPQPAGGGGGRNRGNQQRPSGPPPKPKPPKPLPPITKGMIEGKEPMRTFGDLMQFFQKKKDEPDTPGPTSGPPSV